jgi:hypothetical protein
VQLAAHINGIRLSRFCRLKPMAAEVAAPFQSDAFRHEGRALSCEDFFVAVRTALETEIERAANAFVWLKCHDVPPVIFLSLMPRLTARQHPFHLINDIAVQQQVKTLSWINARLMLPMPL